MLQMRIYSDVNCRSQNCFSQNEHFKHKLAYMLKLLHFTAKLSVFCLMINYVVCSLMELLLLPVCQPSIYWMNCIKLSSKVPIQLSL